MNTQYPIHDLFIEPLEPGGSSSQRSLKIYSFSDHLLKRLDSFEFIELSAGNSSPAILRVEADELWTLLEGQASFHWTDRREDSPTFTASHSLDTNEPTRVLVPFGVEFHVSAQSDCSLLRICTHAADLHDPEIQYSAMEL